MYVCLSLTQFYPYDLRKANSSQSSCHLPMRIAGKPVAAERLWSYDDSLVAVYATLRIAPRWFVELRGDHATSSPKYRLGCIHACAGRFGPGAGIEDSARRNQAGSDSGAHQGIGIRRVRGARAGNSGRGQDGRVFDRRSFRKWGSSRGTRTGLFSKLFLSWAFTQSK